MPVGPALTIAWLGWRPRSRHLVLDSHLPGGTDRMLYEAERHEPLTASTWNEKAAQACIDEIPEIGSRMWWWAAPYYVVRIGEARPTLIVMAAMVAIGILVWKKPRHWTLWIAGVVVGAIVLIFLSERRGR